MMILRQVALVADTSGVSFSDLTRASAALQKQATRDFGPIWDVQATVDAFHKLEDVPLGYWPVIIRDDIGQPGALGVHLDKDNQPFALVSLTDSWQLTASHETLEMLADPFGNRLGAGDSPKPDQGRVEFLVEVCDPCEAAAFGYTVNGITLSDFYTPSYFDPVRADSERYSFTGAVTEPRQVLKDGYLSWHELTSDEWWQEISFGDRPEFRSLGRLDQQAGSLREQIDRLTAAESVKAMVRDKTGLLTAARSYGPLVSRPSERKAQAWREQIERLKSEAQAGGPTPASLQPQRRRPPRRAQDVGESESPEAHRRRPPHRGDE
jgi:hypothetical protein